MSLHDTHVHLEMLLDKLGYWSQLQEQIRSYKIGDKALLDQIRATKSDWAPELEKLLGDHEFVLQSTVSTDNFDLVKNLFGHLGKVYFLLGSHPEIVDDNFNLDVYLAAQSAYLKVAGNLTQVSGIGEVGLDYHYTQDIRLLATQKQLFEAQILLAIQLKLPLVIHCREAFQDLFSILKNHPDIHNRFLVHCFTGGLEECKQVLELGGRIGIGGVATFASSKQLVEAIQYAPLESIVLETDLPFLAPPPHRGKVCLPEYIGIIAEQVGQIKNMAAEEILASSKHDTLQLFPKIRERYGEDQYLEPGNKDYKDSIV